MPKNCEWAEKTNDDIKMFFEWSEQGKHKEKALINTFLKEGRTYFHGLVYGKKRAGIHIHELYETGVLSGDTPYIVLLGGYAKKIYRKFWQIWKPKYTIAHDLVPRYVVDFMKKEMFKGSDAKSIESCYYLLK